MKTRDLIALGIPRGEPLEAAKRACQAAARAGLKKRKIAAAVEAAAKTPEAHLNDAPDRTSVFHHPAVDPSQHRLPAFCRQVERGSECDQIERNQDKAAYRASHDFRIPHHSKRDTVYW